jgi:hypothetical protein
VENTESTSAKKSTYLSLSVQEHACEFLRSQEILHYKFIAKGQRVNQQRYLEVLTRLKDNLFGRKDPNSGLISGFSTMAMPLLIMH